MKQFATLVFLLYDFKEEENKLSFVPYLRFMSKELSSFTCKWNNTNNVVGQDMGINWESCSLTCINRLRGSWVGQLGDEGLFWAVCMLSFWWDVLTAFQFHTGTSSSTGQAGSATTSKYYDDIYFDSDSEDEDKTGKGLREKTASSEWYCISDPVESSQGITSYSPFGGSYQPM